MHILTLIALMGAVMIKTAIIDNCMSYPPSTGIQKLSCLECRAGYYLKNGTCLQCVSDPTAP